MKHVKTILTVVGVLAILVAFTSQASADIVGDAPDFFTLGIDDHSPGNGQGQGPPEGLRPPGIFDNDHRKCTFDNRGTPHVVPNRFSIEWFIEVDADPYVNAIFWLTNDTSEAKDFTINPQINIAPQILGGSLTGGSVSFTVIDKNADGATLSSINDTTPIYMSQIDGNNFKALMAAPISYSVPVNGTDGEGPEEFGPTPTDPLFPGPAISNTIGIELNARLSAGDTAFIVAKFVVIQDPTIPEPATMSLLAFGGVTMLMGRKRRRA